MTSPAATGQLCLEASRLGERTVLTRAYRTVPFHPGPAHYRNGRAEVTVQEVSPGIFPGDRLGIEVVVNAGAALTVAAQGATRVYPAATGIAAELSTSLHVEQAGTLWWLPGELIPFRDAIYLARTDVHLAADARFALLEIVTPGRVAMGESHAYQRLDLRLRLDVAGKPRVVDRMLLEPEKETVSLLGSQGAFNCAGTLIAVGYPVPAELDAYPEDMWIGGDGADGLVVVRGLAHAAAPLRDVLLSILRRMDRQQAEIPAANLGQD